MQTTLCEVTSTKISTVDVIAVDKESTDETPGHVIDLEECFYTLDIVRRSRLRLPLSVDMLVTKKSRPQFNIPGCENENGGRSTF
jgi:hypothetical protein